MAAGRWAWTELQKYFIQWVSSLPAKQHLVLQSTPALPSALLHHYTCTSFRTTETHQSSCATGISFYYSYHAITTQHSCCQQFHFLAIFTVGVKKMHSTGRISHLIEKGDFIQSTVEKYKATWKASSNRHGGCFLSQDTVSTSSGALIQVNESLEQFPIRCTSIHNT